MTALNFKIIFQQIKMNDAEQFFFKMLTFLA